MMLPMIVPRTRADTEMAADLPECKVTPALVHVKQHLHMQKNGTYQA